ncbi:leucyl aminopeptidase [Bacteriovoracaceae bacterium]|nr:leucyl aminopeptidase [Bacteriovoracaceae bacterium]
MTVEFTYSTSLSEKASTTIIGINQLAKEKDKKAPNLKFIASKALKDSLTNLKNFKSFSGERNSTFSFHNENQENLLYGIGDSSKYSTEDLRKVAGNLFKYLKINNSNNVNIVFDSFRGKNKSSEAVIAFVEALYMSDYEFIKYKSESKKFSLTINLVLTAAKDVNSAKKAETSIINTVESLNVTRDFVNEAPNVLTSVEYAKQVQNDVTKNLKGVKVKILNKAQIKKEKMNLFLSVNAGSGYEPRLVHLTYTPKKVTKKTKHFALVGKGIVFDTGGYSLKPSGAMAGMKFDMGGSATVYGAFRAAVLNNSPYKLTCVLAMTDNAVNSFATFPDAIVKGRNGKTVEILNTDAEGRLILADALDYTCDLNPDGIIDAATLTGACLVALGNQVCAVLGNNQKFTNQLLSNCKKQEEYAWELPIINEWRSDIKSKVADIKNIGSGRLAGTAIGAAFLQEFIKNDIPWIHLDIAGVCDSQSHLSYCPADGASGLMVRSLNRMLTNG